MHGVSRAFNDRYRGKRVLLTGHTGFKGSWLALWLQQLGAEITGLSIDIPTKPSLFELAEVERGLDHHFGDVRDAALMEKLVAETNPDIIFHLAAQPLVRRSYAEPTETLATNVLGTANILEAVRKASQPCSVVVITSDKCYANVGQIWGYREIDPMGGHDPYSMSKGAAELVVDSWRNSYFAKEDSNVRLASARAGNVIGGGDWACDRLMTDCIAAFSEGRAVEIRNPLATRPWQHVLEPLSGYLWLGASLVASDNPQQYASGWNFGPYAEGVRSVRDLVEKAQEIWGDTALWRLADEAAPPYEAIELALNCDKSHRLLRWRPVWDFDETVAKSVEWYRQWHNQQGDLTTLTLDQIAAYEVSAKALGLQWAASV